MTIQEFTSPSDLEIAFPVVKELRPLSIFPTTFLSTKMRRHGTITNSSASSKTIIVLQLWVTGFFLILSTTSICILTISLWLHLCALKGLESNSWISQKSKPEDLDAGG